VPALCSDSTPSAARTRESSRTAGSGERPGQPARDGNRARVIGGTGRAATFKDKCVVVRPGSQAARALGEESHELPRPSPPRSRPTRLPHRALEDLADALQTLGHAPLGHPALDVRSVDVRDGHQAQEADAVFGPIGDPVGQTRCMAENPADRHARDHRRVEDPCEGGDRRVVYDAGSAFVKSKRPRAAVERRGIVAASARLAAERSERNSIQLRRSRFSRRAARWRSPASSGVAAAMSPMRRMCCRSRSETGMVPV